VYHAFDLIFIYIIIIIIIILILIKSVMLMPIVECGKISHI